EGCLCGFNKNGMLLQRRTQGRRDRFERVQLDLATVPMAVAASSAFPGFFPPLELNGWEVGADEEEFSRQSFTDGGVYDNLGLRMFRCMEQAGVKQVSALQTQDFLELEKTLAAIGSAASLPEETPLRLLRQKLEAHDPNGVLRASSSGDEQLAKALIDSMSEVIRAENLYRDERFRQIELSDPRAQALCAYATEASAELDLDSCSWLNRQIIEATLRQSIGKPCLRLSGQGFDGILVSDAGGKFKVTQAAKRSGLIGAALRASDILMDRVWQLELEAFESTSGVITMPIGEVVANSKDKYAMPAEIQRQVARFRTDLDRFSDLEVSALIQHGYCVARKICRAENDFLKAETPSDPPWKPLGTLARIDSAASGSASSGSKTESTRKDGALQIARELQPSSGRRIWSTLLDRRDWTSYVWLALVLSIAVAAPLLWARARQRSSQQRAVITAISDMSPDYARILDLLRQGPTAGVSPMPFREVDALEAFDVSGFKVVSDTRIFDLRGWTDGDQTTPAKTYKRLTIQRQASENPQAKFRIQIKAKEQELLLAAGPPSLKPALLRLLEEDGVFRWELLLDLGRLPIGSRQDVQIRRELPEEEASDAVDKGRFNLSVNAETGLLEVWMLLPQGRRHESFEVFSYPTGRPEQAQVVVPHTRVELALDSIATFRLINPSPGTEYECHWTWTDAADAY
ncbi:MAG: patatin-like phospholipase family protein, partial [Planctomycetota bacterium]